MSYFNVSNTIVPKEYQKSKFLCFPKLILNKRKPSMTESLTWRLRYLFNATLVLQIPSVIFLCNYSRNFCVRFTHEICSRMSMGLFMVFKAFFCTYLFVERNNCSNDNCQIFSCILSLDSHIKWKVFVLDQIFHLPMGI